MLGRQVTFLARRPLHVRLAAANTQCLCTRLIHAPGPIYGASLSKPGRPKKAVGEPSRVIKRAVKRVAKKPVTDETDAASQQVAEKQTKAATKQKSKAAAKPKLKAAKKAKPAKKVLTEAQAAAKKVRAAHAKAVKDLKSLKEAALSPPKVTISNAYVQFMASKKGELHDLLATEKEKAAPGDNTYARPAIAQYSKSVAAEWKEQTPAEHEHWNHLAHTSKESALAAYKSWVESHTPEQIKLANAARKSLRRRETKAPKSRSRWPHITDEREPKGAVSPFIQFSISRHASGDFKHIKATERAKLMGIEWKALEEGEKKKYKSLHSADRERYIDEYSSVHGHAPLQYLQSQHPELTHAAAAA